MDKYTLISNERLKKNHRKQIDIREICPKIQAKERIELKALRYTNLSENSVKFIAPVSQNKGQKIKIRQKYSWWRFEPKSSNNNAIIISLRTKTADYLQNQQPLYFFNPNFTSDEPLIDRNINKKIVISKGCSDQNDLDDKRNKQSINYIDTNLTSMNQNEKKEKNINEGQSVMKIAAILKNLLWRRPSLHFIREKGIFKDEPVFGCKLEALCARENQLVPKVVQQCIAAIEHKNLEEDGIYRVCGNLSQVQKIRYQVNHGNYSSIWSQNNIHVLTGVLKLFFRDMRDPLFPCDLFNSLITISSEEHIMQLTSLVNSLPPSNYETLKFLLQHLLRVEAFKDKNRMQKSNLAIVFGPTLMWPSTECTYFSDDIRLKLCSNRVVELLLLQYNKIFS